MPWLDRLAAGILAPLAIWVLASGLDDLFLDLCSLYFWFADRARAARKKFVCADVPALSQPSFDSTAAKSENRIALFIPAWREDGVIQQMLERNLSSIRYGSYEMFVGV